MEAALPSNSKVIIECTDPANLLSQIEPHLSGRLPLRNLHWKSPNRPLRSIDTLNVSFTRTDDGQSNAAFGRRHQIPGLRQTPYVKIFLFRCDDKDAYKETGRKQLKHWIKNHTPPPENKKSSSSQEHHDAFEWLIVHVVLSGTTAATELRTSKHVPSSLGTTDSTDSVSGKSKWPGKASATMYEKLLADFNSSSKSSLDRVVQVRLPKPGQNNPPSALSPAEIDEQWHDLVEKLKITILASFDTRVAQYEDDIKERDAQRTLPGWNFCTFFVLKEGLAKGFENVGLLEDAMIGYDELAAGLDAVVKEQSMRDDGDSSTLLPFSREMKDKLRTALSQLRSDNSSGEIGDDLSDDWLFQIDAKTLPFDPRRKDYQKLILGNDVSALDCRTYIFSRQLELLRRRSKAPIPHKGGLADTQPPPPLATGSGDFLMLAEIGSRGVKFISLAARAMRRDLYRAWGGQDGLTAQDLKTQRDVIDNIVGSWTWTATLQLLDLTNTPALDLPNDLNATTATLARGSTTMSPSNMADGESDMQSPLELNSAALRQNTDQDMFTLETYTGKATVSSIQSPQVLSQREPLKSTKTGADQLASSRAEILLLARRVVERLGSKKGYMQAKYVSTFNDQSSATQSHGDPSDVHSDMLLAGIEVSSLKRIANSAEAFSHAYEVLTDLSCRHFVAANKFKSAERAVVDLALIKYESQDFTTAAEYFSLVANFYGKGTWSGLTESVLEPYATCLKHLNRHEEHVRCLLAMLTTTAQRHRISLDVDHVIQVYLDDLSASSQSLKGSLSIPLLSFFELNNFSGSIHHFDHRDGFFVEISIALRLNASVQASKNQLMHLVAVDEEGPPKKMTLKSTLSQVITQAGVVLHFESKVTASGWFEFDMLEFDVGRIHFQLSMKDVKSMVTRPSLTNAKGVAQLRKPILLFPASRSINVKAQTNPFINLSQPRKLNLKISSNDNNIRDCKISIKSGTAGLRLRIHQTDMVVGDPPEETTKMVLDRDGDIRLSNIESEKTVTVAIPYTLENSETMVLITNLQVTYGTSEGTFVYYDNFSTNTILPISVNVQELFRESELLSRFTISPATLVPLQLIGCDIDGCSQYRVDAGLHIDGPWAVFPKQPASLVYRFARSKSGTNEADDSILLLVDYKCIDDIVLSSLEDQFLKDLANTNFTQLSRLLSTHLLLSYKTKWTEQDLEVALLMQKIDVWPFEEIGWNELLRGLSADTQKTLIPWLFTWHSQSHHIPFGASQAVSRRISIPIEIPTPQVVFTASIRLKYTSTAISLGQPIQGILYISFTDYWRKHDVVEGVDLDISYEVLAPPEHWLLGGRRRGNFTSAPHRQHQFQVLLLPQKTGKLMLPSLEVKCHAGGKETEIPCEIDYQSVGMSVLVIAGLKSTTVALDTEASGIGASFVTDSEKYAGI